SGRALVRGKSVLDEPWPELVRQMNWRFYPGTYFARFWTTRSVAQIKNSSIPSGHMQEPLCPIRMVPLSGKKVRRRLAGSRVAGISSALSRNRCRQDAGAGWNSEQEPKL